MAFSDRANILSAVLRLRNIRAEESIMGEEADRLIEATLYNWETQMDKRVRPSCCRSTSLKVGHIVAWPAGVPYAKGTQSVRLEGNAAIYVCSTDFVIPVGTEVTVDGSFHAKPLCVTVDMVFDAKLHESDQHPSTVVKTNIACSYCQKTGLHWSGQKGVNLHLRDEHGLKHDCGRSKVTINL